MMKVLYNNKKKKKKNYKNKMAINKRKIMNLCSLKMLILTIKVKNKSQI